MPIEQKVDTAEDVEPVDADVDALAQSVFTHDALRRSLPKQATRFASYNRQFCCEVFPLKFSL